MNAVYPGNSLWLKTKYMTLLTTNWIANITRNWRFLAPIYFCSDGIVRTKIMSWLPRKYWGYISFYNKYKRRCFLTYRTLWEETFVCTSLSRLFSCSPLWYYFFKRVKKSFCAVIHKYDKCPLIKASFYAHLIW